jgi:hypothetical protein
MAKVEGSNPFIRLDQNPRNCGGFCFSAADTCTATGAWVARVGSKSPGEGVPSCAPPGPDGTEREETKSSEGPCGMPCSLCSKPGKAGRE